MNQVLQQFVADTGTKFSERLRTPRDLIQRRTDPSDFVDTAVLGGYSVADILHGNVSSTDIDPEIIRAFRLQYPHAGDFVDFVRDHSGDDAAIAGIVNGIKGKLFELEYVNWLNGGHLPAGAVAELAASPTQEGWDVIIKDSHGHVLNHLQLKATESLAYIKEALASYPDIDIVATHEVFEHLNESGLADHVTVTSFSDDDLTVHVRDQIHAADMTPEFEVPLLAFGIIALHSFRQYRKGQLTALEAARSGIKRGWRALLCRAAAYVSILVSGAPILGLPASVLARTAFSRVDAHDGFATHMDTYISALQARTIRLKGRFDSNSTMSRV